MSDDLIADMAAKLTPHLPPAPDGWHWEASVGRINRDPIACRYTATWSLVPTEIYDEEQA